MKNTTIIESLSDEFEAFVYNMFAIDYFKPDGPGYPYDEHDVSRIKDHHVHYDAGIFMCCNPQKEIITSPIHLAHTHEFALIRDTRTNDLMIDFRLNRDVIMMIEKRQAFVIRVGEMIGMIKIDKQEVFAHLLGNIPQEQLLLPDPYREGSESA